MRLDRAISLNLVQPFRRVRFKVQSSGPFPAPILMYHSISDEPEPGVPAYYQTNTSPAVFRQHMQFLADHGYRTISLDQLVSMLTIGLQDYRTTGPQDHGATMPLGPISAFSFQLSAFPKLVCITFDDGFRDFYMGAFPVLQKHGFTATVFLPTAFIAGSRSVQGLRFDGSGFEVPCHFPFRNPHSEFLTWNEVRELRQAGIQFGSHTVNHPRLVELPWNEVAEELRESKQELEQHLGEPVTTFAYPFAFPQANRAFVQDFRRLLAEIGYTCCATTELGRVGLGDDPYRLKRLPANSLDDLGLYRAKLEGCYDWLALAQGMIKTVKRSRVASQEQTDLPVRTRYAGSNSQGA